MAKVELKVTGGQDLARVGRRLREVGDKDLQRAVSRGVQRATKPLAAAARQRARDTLPDAGGLNERVARSKIRTRASTRGRNPGVRITATGVDSRVDSQGRVRHPVYGNRKNWVQQSVPPGWFSEAMEAGADKVRADIDAALTDVARKLEGR